MSSSTGQALRISGTVHAVLAGRPVPDARLFVALEDVSLIDAPALKVATFTTSELEVHADGTLRATFVLDLKNPRPDALYNVRALLDVDGDGRASKGDFISVRSHPVDGRSGRAELQIPLQRIE
jgi:uncharacterized lipoprotein YbaY